MEPRYFHADANGNVTGNDKSFERHFGAGKETGDIQNADHRFIIVILHEFGHSEFSAIDSIGTNGGEILLWENTIRDQLGVASRETYTTVEVGKNGDAKLDPNNLLIPINTKDPFDKKIFGRDFKTQKQYIDFTSQAISDGKRALYNGEMLKFYVDNEKFLKNTPYTKKQMDLLEQYGIFFVA